MEFSLERYRYYVSDHLVVAVSTYAGKPVKGYAKCDPRDEFSVERGKEIAAKRCNAKVAAKRLKRAKAKTEEAYADLQTVRRHYEKMKVYYEDSQYNLFVAERDLKEIAERY